MCQTPSTFHQIAPGIASGPPPTPTWQPIGQCPLVIFVGVTGVGKSTTLDELAKQISFQLLPNRRVLTDDLIIGYLQQSAGQPIEVVTDRAERFALTRRFRQEFPGGMGHALGQLIVDELPAGQRWYVFDGLRGVNEIEAAAATLPSAKFVVLDAPDVVRVQRLLGRGDAFDQVSLDGFNPTGASTVRCFADLGLPEADALFSAEEVSHLLALATPPVGQGTIPVEELLAKLKIVVEERSSYDPSATRAALERMAPSHTLVIDTTQVSAKAAAHQIATWLDTQHAARKTR